MGKIFNTSRKVNLIVTILVGICIILAMLLPAKAISLKNSTSAPIDYFLQLEDGKSVTSNLIRPVYGNVIKSINVLLGTNNKVNEGELQLELIKDDEVVETWLIRTEDVADCHYYVFDSKEGIRFEEGSSYFIRVTNFFDGENNLAVGMGAGNIICSMSATYNNQLTTKVYIAFALILIITLVFLCLKTNFLDLPVYKIVVGGFIAIVLVCIVQFDIFQAVKTDINVRQDADTSLRQSIEPGDTVDFDFNSTYDSFDSLGFHVYGDNFTEYLVTLVNKNTGATYFINSEVNILQRQNSSEGPLMCLYSDSSLCPESVFPEGEYVLSIQNTSPDTVLDIGIVGEGTEDSNPSIAVTLTRNTFLGRYIAIASFILLVAYALVVYYLIDNNKFSVERLFLVTAIPVSLIFLVVFQTMNVPDAEAHFVSAYHVSNGLLGITGDKEWMARAIDATYFKAKNWWEPVPYPDIKTISYAIHHIFDGTIDKTLVSAFPDYTKMKAYSVLNWLPQALGLTLGRVIGANAIITVYLGRLCILVTYIFTCYRAIKNTPVGKIIFCTVALLPVNLMLASSYSYDCMLFIVSINFIAVIFKLRNEVTRNAVIEALIWAFLLGSIKGGGALLLLPLVFLLVKDKKSIVTIVSIIAVSGFAYILFSKILAPDELFQFGVEGDGKLRTSFAFNQPFDYFRMAIRSYIISGFSYVEQILGAQLSWVEPTIPVTFLFALIGITLVGANSYEDTLKLNRKDKVIIGIPVIIALISTPAMLLSYCPLGSYMVIGLQGRYYSSIFPLVLILIASYFGGATSKDKNLNTKLIKVYVPLVCICVYYVLRMYLTR